MTIEEKILKYTQKNFPKESNLIEKSMINYYDIRRNDEKTEKEEFIQNKLYEQVLDLFSILSTEIGENLDIDEGVVYDKLKEIHIKT